MLLAIAKLIRFEKSIANSLTILFPIAYLTQNIPLSIKYSIPVFFILTSGFIINDVNDLEKDRINNSSRALPKNDLSVNLAIFFYYFSLTIALLSIKFLIALNHVFIYLLYLILMTNYDYLVKGYPYLKNVYVALVATIHFTILYLLTSINIFVLLGLVINILCKEIYMDIRDIPGDGNTFAKIKGVGTAGKLVVWLQVLLMVVLLVVLFNNFSIIHCMTFILTLIIFSYNALIWFRYNGGRLNISIKTMIVQNFIIYGLIL